MKKELKDKIVLRDYKKVNQLNNIITLITGSVNGQEYWNDKIQKDLNQFQKYLCRQNYKFEGARYPIFFSWKDSLEIALSNSRSLIEGFCNDEVIKLFNSLFVRRTSFHKKNRTDEK
tara:strand:- start:641 stop:991 length:351 start_codon:yes stop_codon:yes gene_type:complete